MNGKNFRTLYYFIALSIITILFIVGGLQLIGKNNKNQSEDKSLETSADEKSNENEEIKVEEPDSNQGQIPSDQNLYIDAVKDFENKNYQSVIEKLNQAISINPQVTSYYSLKSEAEILLNQAEKAKETLEAGINANPGSEILNSKLDTLEKEYFFPEDQEATRG